MSAVDCFRLGDESAYHDVISALNEPEQRGILLLPEEEDLCLLDYSEKLVKPEKVEQVREVVRRIISKLLG